MLGEAKKPRLAARGAVTRSVRLPERDQVTSESRRRPPLPFPPRGLSRQEAAAYVGVSAPLFDEMVRDGRMPPPKMVNARVIWDRVKVDAFFAVLPERGGDMPVESDDDILARLG